MKQEENEQNEWMHIAPHLAALPKELPFRVPDGYFEGLEHSVMDKIQTPIPGREPEPLTPAFTVPAGYFEQLPLLINERIAEKRTGRIRQLITRPAFSISIAAAFLAALLLTRPALWFHTGSPAEAVTLTADDLGNSYYLGELDESLIIEALADYDATDHPEAQAETDLEDYLIENHIDINQITTD